MVLHTNIYERSGRASVEVPYLGEDHATEFSVDPILVGQSEHFHRHIDGYNVIAPPVGQHLA